VGGGWLVIEVLNVERVKLTSELRAELARVDCAVCGRTADFAFRAVVPSGA
jgi:hypothetical protein